MGLFALATKNTVENDIETAIRNLQLFLEHRDSDYLLDFALYNVVGAKEKINQQKKS